MRWSGLAGVVLVLLVLAAPGAPSAQAAAKRCGEPRSAAASEWSAERGRYSRVKG